MGKQAAPERWRLLRAGPCLQPLQSQFVGGGIPLQEKARVLQLALTLLGRVAVKVKESILPAMMTKQCCSQVPLGNNWVRQASEGACSDTSTPVFSTFFFLQ